MGQRVIIELPPTVLSHNWEIAAEVAQRAKERGYASKPVDGAFLYAAVHSSGLFSYPWKYNIDATPLSANLPNDLVRSGIFLDDRDRNGLWIWIANDQDRTRGRSVLAQS